MFQGGAERSEEIVDMANKPAAVSAAPKKSGDPIEAWMMNILTKIEIYVS